jgi:hypothetical protein
VIATPVGGAVDLIRHGENGILVRRDHESPQGQSSSFGVLLKNVGDLDLRRSAARTTHGPTWPDERFRPMRRLNARRAETGE